jgi:hypothetical protein
MPQFLRPDSNVTQTSWTGGFADIDEATASDADFSYGINNSSTARLEVGTSNPADTPDPAGTATVRWRLAKVINGTLSGTGGTVNQTCGVYEGATLISSSTVTTTGAWVESTFTFSAGDITDWTDVRLRFTQTASGAGAGSARGSAVSWAEIEAPDAATAILTLDCTVGTFALGTTTTGLLLNRVLNNNVGSFAVTGSSIDLSKLSALNINAGNFAVTGQTIDQKLQRLLSNNLGGFSLTGLSVDLDYTPVVSSQILDVVVGDFNLSSSTTGLNFVKRLIGATGLFLLSTTSAKLLKLLRLNVIPNSVVITGSVVTFGISGSFNLSAGVFNLSGQPNVLLRSRRLRNTFGDFNFTLIKLQGLRRIRANTGTRGRVMKRTFKWILGQYTKGNIQRPL